ncbi:drug/metabolite exporter YedA [Streptomyces virginiae]|uniref:Drug/metabolite exporter YedA n=1 Tax=Streptomyces virginiae TaxID=1961 RepID=A0ABQ3NDY5_STRVG|nr:EamA family transporter [Streptomyces virginiae]MBP2346288.1 drug/metabolite transporter (DMT)-like permease [Streptomyces virginiae]GGQ34308.1 drug/metabolite exporter YedA [Streptomyces virginiae]GHI10975.1 drug/metabolite exporter YedA [Streptomyces virginiae]
MSTSTPVDGRPTVTPHGRTTGAVWTALALVYVVWGSTYLGIRIVVETMPPFLSAGARFITAGVLLAAVVAWRYGTAALRATRAQLGSAVLVGLLLILGGNGLVVLAETSVPSGLAALLVAAVPMWVVVLRTATGDRPPARTLAGVVIGLAGLAVLTSPGLSGAVRLSGVLMVLAGSVLWSLGSFSASKLPLPGNPFTGSAYQMLAGGIGGVVVGLLRGEHRGLDPASFSTASWLALGYLVLFGSLVAFTAYVWLLRAAPLSLVATYAYVNPVVAVALGSLILDEALTWPILAGGAVVVAAVVVIVSTERRKKKQ